jgi:hydroxyacylglutathione hydrolase
VSTIRQHVVRVVAEPIPISGTGLVIHMIPLSTDNLGWLLVHASSGEAAIVDGPEAGPVLERCAELGVRLTAILNTHTHGDHIGVNRDLERRGCLGGVRVIGPARAREAVPGLSEAVDEGDVFTFGGARFETWLTEGHLDGHISFLVGDALFCGDTLFTGGCGYLFSGPPAKMFESLSRFRALPDWTHVFCAHEYTLDNLAFARSVEPESEALRHRLERVTVLRDAGHAAVPSTLGEEMATNPFLRWDSVELVAHVRAALPDAALDSPVAIFAATRRLKDLKRYRV